MQVTEAEVSFKGGSVFFGLPEQVTLLQPREPDVTWLSDWQLRRAGLWTERGRSRQWFQLWLIMNSICFVVVGFQCFCSDRVKFLKLPTTNSVELTFSVRRKQTSHQFSVKYFILKSVQMQCSDWSAPKQEIMSSKIELCRKLLYIQSDSVKTAPKYKNLPHKNINL